MRSSDGLSCLPVHGFFIQPTAFSVKVNLQGSTFTPRLKSQHLVFISGIELALRAEIRIQYLGYFSAPWSRKETFFL